MRRAEADRDFEIVAHAHAEIRQAHFHAASFAQKCKMRCGCIVDRRNAHQSRQVQLQFAQPKAMNPAASCGGTPAFWGSSPVFT